MLRNLITLFLFFALTINVPAQQLGMVNGASMMGAQPAPSGVQPSGTPDQLPGTVFYDIYDFSAGLQSHVNAFQTPKGAANNAFNVRVNQQYGSLAKRQPLTTYGTCGHTSSVTGLFRYYTSSGSKQTVTSSGDYLDYISDTGSCTNLYQWPTSGLRVNFITYKNIMIATDGNDLPVKWDGVTQTTADTAGSRSPGYLVSQLGSSFATLSAGAGLTASRWYQYVIAYYNGTSYTYSYAQSNTIQTGAVNNKQITLTNVPLGPPGTTDRYVYRIVGQTTAALAIANTTYYLDKHLSDNSTTTFVDSVSDSTLTSGGGATPTWGTVTSGINVTTPHGTYIFIQNDYIWLANDPSGIAFGGSTVYFSQVLDADYWYPTSYFLIRPDDGDTITGITSFLGALWIPKTNSWSQIYINSPTVTNWSVSQPFSFFGCVAPYSIVSTPVGIFYLGRYGIYNFNGQVATIISDVVTPDFRDINQVNNPNITGVFYNNEYRLAYPSTASGAQTNNTVLVYDTVRNAYYKDTENINAWAIFNSGTDFGGLYSGSSNADGYILAHSIQPTNITLQHSSDFSSGTFSGTGTFGTQNSPIISLTSSAWNADSSAWNSESTSTWVADSSPGTWTSPGYQINATGLSQLFWNAVTPPGTTVTIQLRTASTLGGLSGASYSSPFTNPNGSNISSQSANVWIQMQVNFTTNNLSYTPYLQNLNNYVIQLDYTSNGTIYETTVPSTWTSGWMDLVPSIYQGFLAHYPKLIKEIDVYYTGSVGTLNINFQNLKGDSNANFNINLAQAASQTPGVPYWGYNSQMVYTWLPQSIGGNGAGAPYGDRFQLTVTENGTTQWIIQKIRIIYSPQQYTPYH